MTGHYHLHEAITFDEIGIASARYDRLLLRSAFQLIYERQGGCLRAVAAESFLRPFHNGVPVPPGLMLAALDLPQRASLERLGMALHLANYHHLRVDGLDHILGLGAAVQMPPETDAGSRARLVGSLRLPLGPAAPALADITGGLARAGVRVMLSAAANAAPPVEAVQSCPPTIVRIGGAWFRRVADHDDAMRLLTSLIDGLQRRCVKVLIEGIETQEQLTVALDAGADLVQGFHLSMPHLAGMTVDHEAEIPLSRSVQEAAEVIPLFGDR